MASEPKGQKRVSSLLFDLQVYDNHFTGYLRSNKPIEPHEIVFEYNESAEGILIAKTIDKSTGTVITISEYEKLQES